MVTKMNFFQSVLSQIFKMLTAFRFLILYADFVVTRVILLSYLNTFYGVVNFLLFQTFAVMAVSSHLKTMLTDPVTEDFNSIGFDN